MTTTLDPADLPASPTAGQSQGEDAEGPDDLVEDELLVEEISIDGMCGVY